MDYSRTALRGLLTVFLAITLFSTCDNDELTEEWALYAFGTEGKPPEDTSSPPEDTYMPPGETWTDPTSGLTWQVTPTGGVMSWAEAKTHCSNLGPDGGWHLPTIGELRTLIRGCPATEDGGSCKVTDGCLRYSSCRNSSCDGCSDNHGPADGCYWPDNIEGTCGWYWSSSPVEDFIGYAWNVAFTNGLISGFGVVTSGLHVRCVR